MVIVACSVFKHELDAIMKKGIIKAEVIYLDSMLHMYPKKLEELLNNKIDELKDKNIVLLYGDCHARILDQCKGTVYKVNGVNCCDTILGKKKYKELRREGAFILIHEWLERWEEVFKDELGLKNSDLAKKFMQEMHKKLVYVDTGLFEIPNETLKKISQYTGLPYYIESWSSNTLEKELLRTIKRIANNE